jgi:hypothetical protein
LVFGFDQKYLTLIFYVNNVNINDITGFDFCI